MKKLSLEDFQERLNTIHPKEQLKAIYWGGDRIESIVQCKTCGTIIKKKGGSFVDKRKISICKTCFPTHDNTWKGNNWQPPKGYEQIGPYIAMDKKVLIRHIDCGFIWKITPTNLKLGKGCPRCSKKFSKGERKIITYLEDNNIQYQFQYPITIKGHKLTIDFYLPKQDLYIEYNGEQHYYPIEFFGGDDKFEYQQFNDNLKKEFLKEKLLIIPYTDYENIETILKSSTTISKESTS